MSTDYGFRCVDCGDTLIDSYGQWAMASMYLSLPQLTAFAQAYDALRESFVDFRISSDYGDVDIDKLLVFLRKHGGHVLLIVDEYGDRQYYPTAGGSRLGVVGVDSKY